MVATNARIGKPDRSQISDLKFEIRDANLCDLCGVSLGVLCVFKQDRNRKEREADAKFAEEEGHLLHGLAPWQSNMIS